MITLPSTAHEVMYDRGTIYYLPRKSKYERNFKEIKLPQWLKDVIQREWNSAFNEGMKAARTTMRQALGL